MIQSLKNLDSRIQTKFNVVKLERLVLFSVSINFFITWFAQQIQNINFGTSIGFFFLDTNCADSELSLSSHCFGDLQVFLPSTLNDSDIEKAVEIYPPLSRLFFYPFELLNIYISNNFATVTFLLLAVVLNTFGSHLILKMNNLNSNLFIWLILNFTSLPILVAFERGNSNLYFPFLVVLLLTGVLKQNSKYIFISVMILILIKPQNMLLFFVLLAMKKYKASLNMIIIYISANLFISFLLYQNPLVFIVKFLDSYKSLQLKQTVVDLWPTNISTLHSFSRIALKFDFDINSVLYYGLSAFVYLLLFLLVCNFTKNNFNFKLENKIILFIFFTFCFTFVFYSHAPLYYLIFAPAFLYMYEYNMSKFNTISLNFIFRLNLLFMTFFFPMIKSKSNLTRMGDEIAVFVTYNSYVLLALNLLLLINFIIHLYKSHFPYFSKHSYVRK